MNGCIISSCFNWNIFILVKVYARLNSSKQLAKKQNIYEIVLVLFPQVINSVLYTQGSLYWDVFIYASHSDII